MAIKKTDKFERIEDKDERKKALSIALEKIEKDFGNYIKDVQNKLAHSLDNILYMKLNFLNIKTPKEIQLEIAKNVRKRRKELKLTQEEFSKKSGVSFGSIKRFENTGEISLFSLIKIAIILDCEDEFLNLFQQKQYNSIEEIINEQD